MVDAECAAEGFANIRRAEGRGQIEDWGDDEGGWIGVDGLVAGGVVGERSREWCEMRSWR